MRQPTGRNNPALTDEPQSPAECPACGAAEVTTTSKAVSDSSYWRCLKCGEVWNVGRRAAPRWRVR